MKNLISIGLNHSRRTFHGIFIVLLSLGMLVSSCDKDDDPDPNATYQQINLVASATGYNAVTVDTNLVNAWGLAISPTGSFWISSTKKNRSTVYDRAGLLLSLPIAVDGEPTGVVSNSTVDFIIPSTTLVSKFIYVGEEGTIQSWNSGPTSVEVIDRSLSGDVYKGVDIGILKVIGVLKLIHQNILEYTLVFLPDLLSIFLK